MQKNSKVTKFRKRRTVNISHIMFLIIFVYIFISFYFYITKDHMTIYEVRRGSIAKETVFNGLILREEEVYNTDMAGYVYYYYKDGERVPKNTVIYSIDENKNSTNLVKGELDNSSLSKEEVALIRKEIKNFHENYNNSNYQAVYELKYDLNNVAIEIMNEQKQDSLKAFEGNSGDEYFQMVNSDQSGIVTYYTDNFESLNIEDITYQHYNLQDYSKTLLRKDEIYETGAEAYKLVTDNRWTIIIPLNEEQYKFFEEESNNQVSNITIKFTNEGIESPGTFSIFKKADEYFGEINLEYYMETFINQRFVEVEIYIDNKSGLKIPTSSIVDKEFYLVPHDFLVKGGDSNKNGLVLETYDENNELKLKFVPIDNFYSDDNYTYVNPLLFEPNSWIQSEGGQRLRLDKKDTLKGVYNVNKGYAVFRRVEVIEKNSEYTIVREDTPHGLSVYDQIALLGDIDIEDQIIY